MAVMKKKGDREVPAMSTTSLPDVVYIILFFFMLSTSMRDQELMVTYKLPEATEVQKLEKKNLVILSKSLQSLSSSPVHFLPLFFASNSKPNVI